VNLTSRSDLADPARVWRARPQRWPIGRRYPAPGRPVDAVAAARKTNQTGPVCPEVRQRVDRAEASHGAGPGTAAAGRGEADLSDQSSATFSPAVAAQAAAGQQTVYVPGRTVKAMARGFAGEGKTDARAAQSRPPASDAPDLGGGRPLALPANTAATVTRWRTRETVR
jgi:hypothetical protein